MIRSILRHSALLFFFLSCGPILAADLFVPSQFATIQEAIDVSVDGDRIVVSPGLYNEALTVSQRTIEITSSGGLVTINGGSETTVQSSVGFGKTLTLDGLTITNQPPPFESQSWNGVVAGEGSLVLRNCVITENSTGVFVSGGSGHVIENCTVTDNENHGVKFIGSIGTVEVRDSLFTRNFSFSGGAGLSIESTAPAPSGFVTVESCEFTENEALLYGAGAYLSRLEETEVSQCLFTYNLSPLGGALTVGPQQVFTATICRFIGNEAGRGGGALVDLGSSTSQATFERCLFADNSVTLSGGAISASINGGSIFLNRCTIANNPTPLGGAVAAHGATVLVENSIVWGNGTTFDAMAGSNTVRYSNVEGGYPGEGNIDVDPQFTDPNSGFQYSLLPTSPCIDAGDPAHPSDPDGTPIDLGAIPFETVSSSSPITLAPRFVRGDTNGDGLVDVADPVSLLSYLFSEGPLSCPDRSDANDDGELDVADPVRVLSFLFASGEAPAPPFPSCWWDGTVDALRCDDSSGCE